MQAKKWRGENSEDTCCMCYKDCMPPIVKDGDTLLSARGCILMSHRYSNLRPSSTARSLTCSRCAGRHW